MIRIRLKKRLHAPQGALNLDLNFGINKGEFISVYGNSGAGKTSLLHMIAGLIKPDSGEILCHNTDWYNSKQNIFLTPQKRNVAYVFQEYALFPHMSVRENLCFALKKDQDTSIVDELIDISELHQLENKKPNKLSGGQQQRVALARALVQQADILLLDEPFSALDEKIKRKLQEYILTLQQKRELSCILVSHDREAHIKLSQRVLFLENGLITKEGPSSDLFPTNEHQFQLEGLITKIDHTNKKMYVLIGKHISCISTKHMIIETYKVGDYIALSDPNFQPEARKI